MKNKKKVILILVLLLIISISFVVGQSYSKYMSQIKGKGVAEVAGWSFLVNGQEETVQTINLASTCNNQTLVNNKIAPGTNGKFDIVIDATGSEVGVDYKVTFSNETSKPANLKFTYQGTVFNSIFDLAQVLQGTINANDTNKLRTFTINWQWDYETGTNPTDILKNDKVDTQDGKTIKNYTFDIMISGTQVVPQS